MYFGNGIPLSICLFLSGNPYWVKSNLILPPILGLFGGAGGGLKGHRECRKILVEGRRNSSNLIADLGQEICPCFVSAKSHTLNITN